MKTFIPFYVVVYLFLCILTPGGQAICQINRPSADPSSVLGKCLAGSFFLNVNSNTPVCNNDTIKLFCDVSGGTAPYSYVWSGPAGSSWSSTVQNPVIPNATITGYFNGYFKVFVKDAANVIVSDSTNVEIINPGVNPVNNFTYCNGSQTVGIQFTGSAAHFLWNADNTAIGITPGGVDVIPVFTASNTTNDPIVDTITVVPISLKNSTDTCFGAARTFTITVNPTPAVNGQIDRLDCEGHIVPEIFFAGQVNGTTFHWTNSNTKIGLSASGDGTIMPFTALNPTTDTIRGIISVTPMANGCQGSSMHFMISVYAPFTPGTISADQQVCVGNTPALLTGTPASGGGQGACTYMWFYSHDGNNWTSSGVPTPDYQPPPCYVFTYYRRTAYSVSCGSDNSNIVSITPLPPPVHVTFEGERTVCRNQWTYYKVASPNPNISYNWSIAGNLGTFQGANTNSEAVVLWNSSGTDILHLGQTDKIKGCFTDTSFTIVISTDSAPSKTDILRKANSEILYYCCDQSSGIKFQWGYNPRNNELNEVTKAADTLRYILFQPEMDTITNVYWVDVYYKYSDNVTCANRSYYPPKKLPVGVQKIENHDSPVVVYPNPSSGFVEIRTLEQSSGRIEQVFLYDLTGKKVFASSLLRDQHIQLDLGHFVQNGIYLLEIRLTDHKIIRNKLVFNK